MGRSDLQLGRVKYARAAHVPARSDPKQSEAIRRNPKQSEAIRSDPKRSYGETHFLAPSRFQYSFGSPCECGQSIQRRLWLSKVRRWRGECIATVCDTDAIRGEHGRAWEIIGEHGSSCKIMRDHGSSVGGRGRSWESMRDHARSWTLMEAQWRSWDVVGALGRSWEIMGRSDLQDGLIRHEAALEGGDPA